MENLTNKTRKIISAVLFVITLVLNVLGATGVINGLTQKEVSDMNPTLITPSGPTFSIWSVLYTLLIISIIALFVKRGDPYYEAVTEKGSLFFWLSCLFNSAWIVTFSFELIGISTIFIILLMLSLMLLLREISRQQRDKQWLLPLTFGLYAGWIFIATVVNIAAWLVSIGWNAFGISHDIWAVVISIVAAGLAFAVTFDHRNAAFPLPIAWAFLGIRNELAGSGHKAVQVVAIIMMIVLIIRAVIAFSRNGARLAPASEEAAVADGR